MSYLNLKRLGQDAEPVLVNMSRVLFVEPIEGGSRLYFDYDEKPVLVTASLDRISAMLEAERA